MANTRANKGPAEATYGTFTKDGREVVAYSRKRAVQLRYEGWVEKGSGSSAPPAEAPPTPES